MITLFKTESSSHGVQTPDIVLVVSISLGLNNFRRPTLLIMNLRKGEKYSQWRVQGLTLGAVNFVNGGGGGVENH